MKRIVSLLFCLLLTATFSLAAEPVTIEFIQWWAPELPQGALQAMMDDFTAKNPGIEVNLISGPWSSTHDQIVAGAATGTLSDVVGLDGAWVNDLAKQDAIAPMDSLIASTKYNASQIAAICKLDGKSYMFPVVSFIYPIFYNMDLLKAAGINKMPTTRSEFLAAARKLTSPGKNQYGFVLPLSLQAPNGIADDVMSWVWASQKSMLKNGKPDLTNPEVVAVLKYFLGMYKEGLLSPGTFTKQSQDKVEEFVNGRVAMMVDGLSHVNLIRERNPNLNFAISAMPVADNYKGAKGVTFAAWGIGISQNSKHKDEAWKLITYLMSPDVNTKLSSIAHAFPGNVKAGKPDFVTNDPLLGNAFDIFQSGKLINEFVGLPVAVELQRQLDEEMQLMFDGKQTAERAAANAQAKWSKSF